MILFSCIPQKILSGKRHIGHLRFSYVDCTYLVANQFGSPINQWIPHKDLGFMPRFQVSNLSMRLPDQVSPPSQMLWKCMVWYLKGLQTKSQASPWRFWMPKMRKWNSGSFQTCFCWGLFQLVWRLEPFSFSPDFGFTQILISFHFLSLNGHHFSEVHSNRSQCNLTTDVSSLRWKVPSMCHPVRLARQQLLPVQV